MVMDVRQGRNERGERAQAQGEGRERERLEHKERVGGEREREEGDLEEEDGSEIVDGNGVGRESEEGTKGRKTRGRRRQTWGESERERKGGWRENGSYGDLFAFFCWGFSKDPARILSSRRLSKPHSLSFAS